MNKPHFFIKVKNKRLNGIQVPYKPAYKNIYSIKKVSSYKKPHFVVDKESLEIRRELPEIKVFL